MGRLVHSHVAATQYIFFIGIGIQFISGKLNSVRKMVSNRSSTESLSFFLSAFNQVLLGYTLLAILLSVSMDVWLIMILVCWWMKTITLKLKLLWRERRIILPS